MKKGGTCIQMFQQPWGTQLRLARILNACCIASVMRASTLTHGEASGLSPRWKNLQTEEPSFNPKLILAVWKYA